MKVIISFLLRNLPRSFLQRISSGVFYFLKFFYTGNRVECPVCQARFRKFLPYGRHPVRDNVLCPNCLSLERHRLMWIYLKERTDFFTHPHKVLHIAPENCFIRRFEKMPHLDYVTADLESPLARIKMDIHHIPFGEEVFDVVFCNHVMEHVEDDLLAMKEIYRVLKKGGWAIIQSPILGWMNEKTFEDPTITDPKERDKVYGQNDHVRLYGKDYPDRLRQAGFEVKEERLVYEIPPELVLRYALPGNEIIYRCTKP